MCVSLRLCSEVDQTVSQKIYHLIYYSPHQTHASRKADAVLAPN
jgi:hypothetical protein